MSTISEYNIEKFENFSSKKEQEKTNVFHKQRTAFMIINNEIKFLQNSTKSHYNWAKEFNLTNDEFNKITRGYCLLNDIIFYKGNFEFDEQVIINANKFYNQIMTFCNLKTAKIYAGLDVGNGEIWPPKKFLFEI